jgi:hypothetical protein
MSSAPQIQKESKDCRILFDELLPTISTSFKNRTECCNVQALQCKNGALQVISLPYMSLSGRLPYFSQFKQLKILNLSVLSTI